MVASCGLLCALAICLLLALSRQSGHRSAPLGVPRHDDRDTTVTAQTHLTSESKTTLSAQTSSLGPQGLTVSDLLRQLLHSRPEKMTEYAPILSELKRALIRNPGSLSEVADFVLAEGTPPRDGALVALTLATCSSVPGIDSFFVQLLSRPDDLMMRVGEFALSRLGDDGLLDERLSMYLEAGSYLCLINCENERDDPFLGSLLEDAPTDADVLGPSSHAGRSDQEKRVSALGILHEVGKGPRVMTLEAAREVSRLIADRPHTPDTWWGLLPGSDETFKVGLDVVLDRDRYYTEREAAFGFLITRGEADQFDHAISALLHDPSLLEKVPQYLGVMPARSDVSPLHEAIASLYWSPQRGASPRVILSSLCRRSSEAGTKALEVIASNERDASLRQSLASIVTDPTSAVRDQAAIRVLEILSRDRNENVREVALEKTVLLPNNAAVRILGWVMVSDDSERLRSRAAALRRQIEGEPRSSD